MPLSAVRSLTTASSRSTGSPVPQPRQPPGAHQAREADITLHEPQLHDYMLEGYGADDAFRAGLEGEHFEGPAFGEGDEVRFLHLWV